ncbi:phage protein [Bacillus sp. JCM 19047]|nr:phage protein [Bacillus sp. JCM 19047]
MQKENSHVAKEVIKTAQKRVQEDVYDQYDPRIYTRTGKLKDSWGVENRAKGIAVLSNRYDDNDKNRYVAQVVETGQGYQFEFSYEEIPRPFIANTREELRNSGVLSHALMLDLKAAGFKIK